MDRLRPRQRQVFSGFSKTEIEKMEQMHKESRQPINKEFFQKIARSFNYSSARAGKPIVKWTEVESWFQNRQRDCPSRVASTTDASKGVPCPKSAPSDEAKESSQMPKGEKAFNLSEMEFEARSSKDGAWYDVDMFLCHRYLPSGEAEVLVRFVGFGAEEDEWVNIKKDVRERSVPLEHSECHKVQVGDLLCCFQERRDQAIYYDAHVIGIQKKMHDIRGCRCLFLIRYDHDNTEERVRLRRLCRRPTY
ncbi:protein SAWADEE HOMEODOMAIN HOMOLOG 1 isoform X1 [Ricinus communis]|uniref:protein SAWADEE HOMEODOMAIN HOMOLOG 1 isoform X1 n=2 Tax=Ricinus communis TaxID=3988 RepID=UPI000772CC73|nr:protein SAWADEE HOMEODOMAIN HOMOLOG 1 isoform X1 [Ricinus communis]|eukprot:XP_015573104.1 protein SAWADEE HOMEODOMAIN HOMOLOG 1 isoform X1 [Ricinus communis]